LQTRFFIGITTTILRVCSYILINYSETSTGPNTTAETWNTLAQDMVAEANTIISFEDHNTYDSPYLSTKTLAALHTQHNT
jgi:hypothetical protein